MSEDKVKRRTRTYSSEFKQEAVKLAISSPTPVSTTAKELGIPAATLHTWIHGSKLKGEYVVANAEGTTNKINMTELLAENKTLRKRLARLEQEKAILKKAAAYFAKEME